MHFHMHTRIPFCISSVVFSLVHTINRTQYHRSRVHISNQLQLHREWFNINCFFFLFFSVFVY